MLIIYNFRHVLLFLFFFLMIPPPPRSTLFPYTTLFRSAPWIALSERNSPGAIMVNMSGNRFMNESLPYVEAGHKMYGGEHRSEEHTSELQSHVNLVCRLLLEKKKKKQ